MLESKGPPANAADGLLRIFMDRLDKRSVFVCNIGIGKYTLRKDVSEWESGKESSRLPFR